jgi:uncharacterized protein
LGFGSQLNFFTKFPIGLSSLAIRTITVFRKIFFDEVNLIRSIWWIPIFFLLLAFGLFPIIILGERYSFEVSIPIQALLLITVTIACQLLRRKHLQEITGAFGFTWLKQFSYGIAIGAGLMLMPAIVLTVLGYARWTVNDFSFSTLLAGFTVFIGVAVAEELLFRGFIFQRLIQSLGQWPAQIIIAGLFLLTHINNPGMAGSTKVLASLNIFIASIVFGLAFIKTKSLAMPMGLHFMANYMQGTVMGFGVSGEKEKSLFVPLSDDCPAWLNGGEFGLEASLLGLVAIVVVAAIFHSWKGIEFNQPASPS